MQLWDIEVPQGVGNETVGLFSGRVEGFSCLSVGSNHDLQGGDGKQVRNLHVLSFLPMPSIQATFYIQYMKSHRFQRAITVYQMFLSFRAFPVFQQRQRFEVWHVHWLNKFGMCFESK